MRFLQSRKFNYLLLVGFLVLLLLQFVFAAEFGETEKVIVGFEDRGPLGQFFAASDPVSVLKGHGAKIDARLENLNIYKVSIDEDRIDGLKNSPGISFVEKDQKIHLLTPQTIPQGIEDVRVPEAHSAGITGLGVKVALIDTGVDYNHEDLADNYLGGFDFYNLDSDPIDDHGHGTLMAGILAAQNNDFGVIGVAPDAGFYALKILNENGEGFLSDALLAIEWAIQKEVDVISMSFGSPDFSFAMEDAVDRAYEKNIILVGAAGNSGEGVNGDSTVEYPAKYRNVLAVSAVDSDNNIASFSSRGSEVAFAAPGVNVISTFPGDSYGFVSGTSPSTPHVAGVASLYKQVLPHFTNAEIIALMKADALDLGTVGPDDWYGSGLIQSHGVIDFLDGLPEPSIDLETRIDELEERIDLLEIAAVDQQQEIDDLENRTTLIEGVVELIKGAICSFGDFSFCNSSGDDSSPPVDQTPPDPECSTTFSCEYTTCYSAFGSDEDACRTERSCKWIKLGSSGLCGGSFEQCSEVEVCE